MAKIIGVQYAVFVLVCFLVLHHSCYVIHSYGEQSGDTNSYEKNVETATTKCLPRSTCVRLYTASLCDDVDFVCPDSDPSDENSTLSTDDDYSYDSYASYEKGPYSNYSFFPNDNHTYHTYSHISSSTWGYIIMAKIFIIIFLRMFCCTYRRSSILLIPASSTGVTCHEISNPMASQHQHQQETHTCELSRCPLSTQDQIPTVTVESRRQKDESPPPPYPMVVPTEMASPPDYNTLFPTPPTSTSLSPLPSST